MKIQFEDLIEEKQEELIQEEMVNLQSDDERFYKKEAEKEGMAFNEFIRGQAIRNLQDSKTEMSA